MANATNDEDEPVIEGEFIEADDPSQDSASGNSATELAGNGHRSGLKRAASWLPWGLLLILLVFVGGLFAAPAVEQQLVTYGLMAPREPAPQTSSGLTASGQGGPDRNDTAQITLRLDDLELTLTAMGRRIKTLETALAAVSDESAETRNRLDTMGERPALSGTAKGESLDLSSYEARLSALRERLDALEATVNTDLANERRARAAVTDKLSAAQSDRQRLTLNIDALSGRLNSLERPAPRTRLTVTPGIFPAILALGRHLENGTAYGDVMAPLQAWSADKPAAADAIDTLAQHAGDGVPTLSALQRAYGPLQSRMIRAEQARQTETDEGDKSWFQGLKDKVSGIVVIHPKDQTAEDTDANLAANLAAKLASAERALQDGQLEDAVTIIEKLAPDIRAPADGWLVQARDRLAATNAFHTLLGVLQDSPNGQNSDRTGERP